MNILIAIDSFKGSLSSIEAGNTIKDSILSVTDANITVKPLADGGEGTTEALVEGFGGKLVQLSVQGPLNDKVLAQYGIIESTKTAIIEMASAAGITLVSEKDPMNATTFGVGEMINDAITHGCRNFIVGIGGSATNDGGVGMLQALGFSFKDDGGNEIGFGAKDLNQISFISSENANPLLKKCVFNVACDVENPLCGENGATYIYGPQKGVTDEMKPILDGYMAHFALKTTDFLQKDDTLEKGTGAAGGMGYAFVSYLNAKLSKGVELVLDSISIDDELKTADIVITGEGCLDYQTAMGKAPIGVAKRAKKYGCKVIAFSGITKDGCEICNEHGIDAYFPILQNIIPLEQALEKATAQNNLSKTVKQVFNLILAK